MTEAAAERAGDVRCGADPVVSQNRIGKNVNEAMVLRAAPMGFSDEIGARTRI